MVEQDHPVEGTAVLQLTDVGHVVRRARLHKGLTQSEVAATAGVSRKWVSDLERGKSPAPLGLVVRALAAVDCVLVVANRPSPEIDLDALLSSYEQPPQ